LNITEESDSAKYLSLKTLWSFRQLIAENGLGTPIFNEITDKLSQVFQVDTDNQRIDSVHIKSNMRRLGRISIFTTCIHKFLVNLKRSHAEHFADISDDVIGKYISEKALSCFSMVKSGTKHYYLRYPMKSARIAKRRAYEQTDEFKERYRWRAGVEATMSEYDRRTGVKQLRFRGLKAVRFANIESCHNTSALQGFQILLSIANEPDI
jgi:hypothetical protein